jgi:ABC-type multidrug transport system permease subunit
VVTHSPEIINSSDGLILMARGGQLAFQGPPAEALRVAGVADVAGLFAQTSAMPCVQPSSRAVQPGPTPQPTPASVAPIKSAARELGILARRYVACLMADKRNLAVLLLQAPLLGVLMALLFRGPVFDLGQAVSGDGTAPVDDALKLLLGLVVAALWMGLVNSARVVVKERPILRRERLGVVRFSTYLASKSLVLALLALVQVGVLTPIVASQAAVPPDHWPALLLILYLVTVGATGIGLLLSAVSRGVDQAMSAAVVVMVQQLLFAGGLRPIEEMSTALRLVADLTLARWALGGSCAAVGVVELYENLHREKVLTDVMRTDYSTALGVLAALALLPLVAAWPAGQAVLRHSDRE